MEKQPENKKAYVLRADMAVAGTDYDYALKMYNKAEELGADHGVFIKKANVLMATGNYEEGIKYYKKASDAAPQIKDTKLLFFEAVKKYLKEKYKEEINLERI